MKSIAAAPSSILSPLARKAMVYLYQVNLMAQMTFSVPSEVRRAVLKLRQIDWDDLVSHLLWEYTKRLQLAHRLTRHSRLTVSDVADIDAKVKSALAKRYRMS